MGFEEDNTIENIDPECTSDACRGARNMKDMYYDFMKVQAQ